MTTENLYKIFLDSTGVSTDSRAITPGSIFFALKGDNFDGNSFALKAIAAGAKYSVVDDRSLVENSTPLVADSTSLVADNTSIVADSTSLVADNTPLVADSTSLVAEETVLIAEEKSLNTNDVSISERENLIVVNDVLQTLQDLARYHRIQLAIPIVGLTGTNGKTTTKELITIVLATKYKVSSTTGNLNNHIGVPLTILKMDKTTQIGVVEMGASAPGEIATLVSISQPNYGLITNVGRAHLLGFGSFDGVKNTKGELYDFLQKNGGTALYNIDNPHLCEMTNNRPSLKTVPYGLKYDGYEILPTTSAEPFLRMKFQPRKKHNSDEMHNSDNLPNSDVQINTNLIGAYNADNIIAALAVGELFNVDPSQAADAISKYVPSNNRSQLVKGKNNILIVDAYNANPTSMKAALENFVNMEKGESSMIIGDMLELGAESQNEHKAILQIIYTISPTHLMFVGEEFAKAFGYIGDASQSVIGDASCVHFEDTPEIKNAKFFKTSLELRDYLIANPITGNTFLIKGSRGTRLERVLDTL